MSWDKKIAALEELHKTFKEVEEELITVGKEVQDDPDASKEVADLLSRVRKTNELTAQAIKLFKSGQKHDHP